MEIIDRFGPSMRTFSVPSLHTGEIMDTWLNNYAIVNSFPNYNAFARELQLYIIGKKKLPALNRKNLLLPSIDDNNRDIIMQLILSSLPKKKVDLILKHTIAPIINAFMGQNEPGRINFATDTQPSIISKYNILNTQSWETNPKFGSFLDLFKIRMASEVRYCPECIIEDMKRDGLPHARIVHNFPCVCVCHEHECSLVTFPGGIPSPKAIALHCSDNNLPNNILYSRFVADLVDYVISHPDTLSIEKILMCINSFIQNAHVSVNRVIHSVIASGYIDLRFPNSSPITCLDYNHMTNTRETREILGYEAYAPHILICVLVHLFGSFDSFLAVYNEEKPLESSIKMYLEKNMIANRDISRSLHDRRVFTALKEQIRAASNNNCILEGWGEKDDPFIRIHKLPDFPAYKNLKEGVNAISWPLLCEDLQYRTAFLSIPANLSYDYQQRRSAQIRLFSENCKVLLDSKTIEKRAPVLSVLKMLAYKSYTLLSRVECERLLADVVSTCPLYTISISSVTKTTEEESA